jgi:putative intracellular protease/amidase
VPRSVSARATRDPKATLVSSTNLGTVEFEPEVLSLKGYPPNRAVGSVAILRERKDRRGFGMTKVLIVLTGAKEWRLKDGSKHFGGVWSPEFVYPHERFTKAGYEVVVATLGGLRAIVDPASLSLGLLENGQAAVDFQREYLRRPEIEASLARPARLEELNSADFDVIFVPGGFGVFEDLGDNAVVGRIVAKAFGRDGKVVGTVCSGVSALLGARADDGSWPFVGRRVCGFPTTEMSDF